MFFADRADKSDQLILRNLRAKLFVMENSGVFEIQKMFFADFLDGADKKDLLNLRNLRAKFL